MGLEVVVNTEERRRVIVGFVDWAQLAEAACLKEAPDKGCKKQAMEYNSRFWLEYKIKVWYS